MLCAHTPETCQRRGLSPVCRNININIVVLFSMNSESPCIYFYPDYIGFYKNDSCIILLKVKESIEN